MNYPFKSLFICVCVCAHACSVVTRQYSAVLRMLQMRQSSSTVNLAASEPSFSFSRLLMVRPPLLLLDLQREKHGVSVEGGGGDTRRGEGRGRVKTQREREQGRKTLRQQMSEFG